MSSANVFEGDLGLSLSKLATNELHSNNDWKISAEIHHVEEYRHCDTITSLFLCQMYAKSTVRSEFFRTLERREASYARFFDMPVSPADR